MSSIQACTSLSLNQQYVLLAQRPYLWTGLSDAVTDMVQSWMSLIEGWGHVLILEQSRHTADIRDLKGLSKGSGCFQTASRLPWESVKVQAETSHFGSKAHASLFGFHQYWEADRKWQCPIYCSQNNSSESSLQGFSGGTVKNTAANAGDMGLIPGLGRFHILQSS